MVLGGQVPDFDTVVLAGGMAARMNGADKPGLDVGGDPMLVLVARAGAAAGTAKLIVVGPERGGAVGRGLAEVASSLPRGLVTVREAPSGAGPVPALRCGLAMVGAPWLALLAADLPFLTGHWVSALLDLAVGSGQPGAMLADDGGRPQWLAGCWQTSRLRSAAAGYSGDTLRGLLRPLGAVLLSPEADVQPPWQDCDSPAELSRARDAAARNTDAAAWNTDVAAWNTTTRNGES
jgi:molybdopterin-guanine dinucleotide biosynthesis protein A